MIVSLPGKSDSWQNPTWTQMLDDSEEVVLVEYTSSGKDRSRAKLEDSLHKVFDKRLAKDGSFYSPT